MPKSPRWRRQPAGASHRRRALALRWLAPALGAALTGALLTRPLPGAAAAGPGSSASAIAVVRAAAKGGARPQDWTVTLVTGDRVRVTRDPAGHQQVTTTPRPATQRAGPSARSSTSTTTCTSSRWTWRRCCCSTTSSPST